MSNHSDTRQFSSTLRDTNSAFLPAEETPEQPVQVGFVLLEHFSMMAFTAAVDALVTANLVRTAPLFDFSTFALDSLTVKSDLGIDISASALIEQLHTDAKPKFDILIIVGGFRCELSENSTLSSKLKTAAKSGTTLGALWNGAIALAYTKLLDNKHCALHPENHAFMSEHFPLINVSDKVLHVDEDLATSAGPSSALEMMLMLIEQRQGGKTVRAVREILSCDQVAEQLEGALIQVSDDPSYPDMLRDLLQVMSSNIEDPLTIDELASCAGVSRRRIERLFQTHLDTSPSKYYLELRITHARRLLLQGPDSIANIAVASGFVSSTHFSHCYKDYFGISPSQARLQHAQS